MSTVMELRLGELLVKDDMISKTDLDLAIEKQKEKGGSLGKILTEMEVVDEWEIGAALGKHLGHPFIYLSQYEIDEEVLKSIPADVARKYQIVPMDKTGDTLTVALADPSNIYVLDELRLVTKCQIVPVISFETDIAEAIQRYYSDDGGDSSSNLEEMLKEISSQDMEIIHETDDDDELDLNYQVDDAPVVQLVNVIITEAIRDRASDIHIEPYEKNVRLRYRIDGVLQERPSPPKKLQNAITSRLKILAEMDIAEKRLPQDGRFKIRFEGKQSIDFRVSSMPTSYGEKIVLRILDQSNLMLDLTQLGFDPEELAKFEEEIHKPWGMILVTGPTGSGKSTTLYSALSTINSPTKNINTIEEPVEYSLHGINQVSARSDIGFTFAEGLKNFLRQDPDIIMVGEIRDYETAEVAIKAALTGHLVVSTLHTNDAPSTVSRLTNMGIEPYLVIACLNMVVAQRLVRRICQSCSESYSPSPDLLASIGVEENSKLRFYRGVGCNDCRGTGYKSRVALYEIMIMSDKMRDMIVRGATPGELKKQAIADGMRSLRGAGIEKILDGVTTVEEILSSTVADTLL